MKNEVQRANTTFLMSFAQKYGLREGIVLSEMCRRRLHEEEGEKGLTAEECARLMPYISERRLRAYFARFSDLGYVRLVWEGTSLNKSRGWVIAESLYQEWTKEILKDRQSLLKGIVG